LSGQNFGYKLLRENDRNVLYSSDVKFLEDSIIELLENTTVTHDSFYDTLKKQEMICMSAAMHDGCPQTYQEAVESKDKIEWKEAMDAEMSQMKRFNTWNIKVNPKDVKAVKSKWVFTKKYDS
jgi:hypothetical protein